MPKQARLSSLVSHSLAEATDRVNAAFFDRFGVNMDRAEAIRVALSVYVKFAISAAEGSEMLTSADIEHALVARMEAGKKTTTGS